MVLFIKPKVFLGKGEERNFLSMLSFPSFFGGRYFFNLYFTVVVESHCYYFCDIRPMTNG